MAANVSLARMVLERTVFQVEVEVSDAGEASAPAPSAFQCQAPHALKSGLLLDQKDQFTGARGKDARGHRLRGIDRKAAAKLTIQAEFLHLGAICGSIDDPNPSLLAEACIDRRHHVGQFDFSFSGFVHDDDLSSFYSCMGWNGSRFPRRGVARGGRCLRFGGDFSGKGADFFIGMRRGFPSAVSADSTRIPSLPNSRLSTRRTRGESSAIIQSLP